MKTAKQLRQALQTAEATIARQKSEYEALEDTRRQHAERAMAVELQLDTRICELTVERDAARAIPPPVPATLCERKLECGGTCRFAKHHPPPCLCAGDVDGVPGTCGA